MKKSFTMIELIFVIVIIGILAAIAIPKLAATRDDARTAVVTSQLQSGMRELIAYYTSQGGEVNFSKIETSSQIAFNELIKTGWIEVKDDNHSVFYSNKDDKTVCINFKTNGVKIEVDANSSDDDPLCEDVKRIIKDRNYSVLNSVVNY